MSASSQSAVPASTLAPARFRDSKATSQTNSSAHRFAFTHLLDYWHLLSLDAPTVASLWVLFIAKAARVRLPWSAPAAMFVAVWVLYACDRLLDARGFSAGKLYGLEARHRFHFQHRNRFLWAVGAGCVSLPFLLRHALPATMRLYLVLGLFLLVWLLFIHLRPAAHRLPKELVVGVFFPASVFIPTVARTPALRLALLPSALLMAAICSLNCLFIYAWEHPKNQRQAHVSTQWAVQHLSQLGKYTLYLTLAVGWLLSILFPQAQASLAQPAFACAVSLFCLMALHKNHEQLAPVTLRASADLVLLTPILFLAFGRVLLP